MEIISTSLFNGRNDSLPPLITLRNRNGLVAQFTGYGARWVSLWCPDRNGLMQDVLLGFDTLSGYQKAAEHYHGAIVGRVCGRISQARFTLGDREYRLAANDAYGKPEPNHLHGGIKALHNRIWNHQTGNNEEGEEYVEFSCLSPHGEEGYPGNLRIHVIYTLTQTNVLRMECRAVTDRLTPVNLTNHVFFNLQGIGKQPDVSRHHLQIQSSRLIVCDEELIPTGELSPLSGTYLDFQRPATLFDSLRSAPSQVRRDNGFSVAFALDKHRLAAQDLSFAASLTDKQSGRCLSLYTNQPSLQVYNGYFMDGTDIGKGNHPYYASAGIALETQGFPDAVHHPEFPSVLLDTEETYSHVTEYRLTLIC